MMNETIKNAKMPLWRKIGYGVGGFGENIGYTTVTSFILLYCTNVLGLSSAVIGTLILLSRFLDGVSDVFMGNIIDHTKSKAGKARFWYIVSAFPVALMVFLLFNIPAFFSATTQYIYFFICYVLMSAVFYTMSNISYMSLIALVTDDTKERTQMASYMQIFSMVAVLVLSYCTMTLAAAFGGGDYYSHKGWMMMGLIYAVLTFVTILIPAFCVREKPIADTPQAAAASGQIGFWASLKLLITNKYFVIMLLINFFNYFSSGITGSVGSYFAIYVLGNASALGTLSLTTTVPIILFMSFMPPLIAKIGNMRTSCLIGAVVMLIGAGVALFGSYAGFGVLLAGLIIKGFGSLPGGACIQPMMASSAAYIQRTSGNDITGSFFACFSVGAKVGTGLGAAVCGFLLEMGGYNGLAETQTADAINTIRLMYTLAPFIVAIFTLVLWYLHDVEKKTAELDAVAQVQG